MQAWCKYAGVALTCRRGSWDSMDAWALVMVAMRTTSTLVSCLSESSEWYCSAELESAWKGVGAAYRNPIFKYFKMFKILFWAPMATGHA